MRSHPFPRPGKGWREPIAETAGAAAFGRRPALDLSVSKSSARCLPRRSSHAFPRQAPLLANVMATLHYQQLLTGPRLRCQPLLLSRLPYPRMQPRLALACPAASGIPQFLTVEHSYSSRRGTLEMHTTRTGPGGDLAHPCPAVPSAVELDALVVDRGPSVLLPPSKILSRMTPTMLWTSNPNKPYACSSGIRHLPVGLAARVRTS